MCVCVCVLCNVMCVCNVCVRTCMNLTILCKYVYMCVCVHMRMPVHVSMVYGMYGMYVNVYVCTYIRINNLINHTQILLERSQLLSFVLNLGGTDRHKTGQTVELNQIAPVYLLVSMEF